MFYACYLQGIVIWIHTSLQNDYELLSNHNVCHQKLLTQRLETNVYSSICISISIHHHPTHLPPYTAIYSLCQPSTPVELPHGELASLPAVELPQEELSVFFLHIYTATSSLRCGESSRAFGEWRRNIHNKSDLWKHHTENCHTLPHSAFSSARIGHTKVKSSLRMVRFGRLRRVIS